ncbi:MAG: rod shape-determining protein [Bacteroidetes bacterium]|nr:rod shape-determining protein [Bacteroidota bacterium]
MWFYNNLNTDVAVDLGTANTLIYIKGQGIILNEASIVAIDRRTDKVLAIGNNALTMHEKTHNNIKTVRPLKDGVIADFEMAEQLIRGLIRKVQTGWIKTIRQMVICIPSGTTEVEKRTVRDSAQHAGARKVHLIAEPMAAAIGIGLNVSEPVGNMIVDIGGGTTEIAVIALNGIVVDESLRVAGNEIDTAILSHFKHYHNFVIGQRTAERMKQEIGSAAPMEPEMELSIKGQDSSTGMPKVQVFTSEEVRRALSQVITNICSAVSACLEKTSPELGADILERGIMLTGGGALLYGIDAAIRNRVDVPVYIADDPLTAVVRGTGKILEDVSSYSDILL